MKKLLPALLWLLPLAAYAAVPAVLPGPPTTLACVANGVDVVCTWSAPAKNTDGSSPAKVSGYNLYKSTSATIVSQANGGAAPLANGSVLSSPASLSYIDKGAAGTAGNYAANAWYCDATGACGEGAVSAVFTYVPAPAVTVTGTVPLSWIAPTTDTGGAALTDLTGYNVYRGATCSALGLVANVPTVTYTDSGLAVGTYCYAVTALSKSEGESAQSATLSVLFTPPTPLAKPNPPGAPTAQCTVVAPAGMKASCSVTP
jgi:hypothetical protein